MFKNGKNHHINGVFKIFFVKEEDTELEHHPFILYNVHIKTKKKSKFLIYIFL